MRHYAKEIFAPPPWWKLFFVWRKVSIPSKETHSSCLSFCKERHKETRVCRLEPWKQWYYTRSKFHLQDTAIRVLFLKFPACHMHSFPKFLLLYLSFRIIFLKFYPWNFIQRKKFSGSVLERTMLMVCQAVTLGLRFL